MGFMERFRRTSMRDSVLSLEDYANYFSYQGLGYPLGLTQTLSGEPIERIEGSFESLVRAGYKSNGPIFACLLARMMLFSEARFLFQKMDNGRPGELHNATASPFSTGLKLLDKPWPGGTTGDLLARAMQDADLAGNFYGTSRGRRVRRLRPDWVDIVLGSEDRNADITAEDWNVDVVGYLYYRGGRRDTDPEIFGPDEICHFAPNPDPVAHFRGMSWLSPVITEIMADSAATRHKLKFFENGATPNMVVKTEHKDIEKFKEWVKVFKEKHRGVDKAYEALFLGAGADATVVGTNFRQLEFKVTQGAGESRVAAAAGVPPVIAGFSEGLEAATYSNYGQARRRFADLTIRPLWRNFAGSAETLAPSPSGSRLWYDDYHIPFLQEDLKDEATIQQTQAAAIRQLIDAGFEAASVVAAVTAGDLSRLEHTGLFSVQLQPAGSSAADPSPPANGNEDDGARAREAVEAALAGLHQGGDG